MIAALSEVPMNDEQRNFVRQLIHHAINSATTSLIWRLPTLIIVVLLAALIGAVFYFNLY